MSERDGLLAVDGVDVPRAAAANRSRTVEFKKDDESDYDHLGATSARGFGERLFGSKNWRSRAFVIVLFACLCALGTLATLRMSGGKGVTAAPRLGAAAPRAINAPGHIPGLAEHVQGVTRSTKFRIITFCNKSYWVFAHGLLESMKAVAPSVVDFWTVIVPDEETKKFILSETSGAGHAVDVFVDDDLRKQVAKFASAGRDELKTLLSWRRVHAMQTLVDGDFTVMFIEPDAVFQKNPLQLIHDQLTQNDIILSADYGLGSTAQKRANTKVIVAKPSAQGKKLLNVWQRAEQSYTGQKAEAGFFLDQVVPHIDVLTAKVKVLDQTLVGNYLTHHEKAGQVIVTGTGCDNIDYKINFMTQLLRHVQPLDPNNLVPAFDYDGVAMGCDHSGREKVFKISNEYARSHGVSAKLGASKKHPSKNDSEGDDEDAGGDR